MKNIMRFIKRFTGSQHGSALPIVGLAVFALVGATGAAIDMGRLQIVQSRLQTSLDDAGLAAGANASTTNANTQALNYFNATFPANYLGSTVHDWSVTVASDNTTINLSVMADVPMTFMQLFGTSKVTVSASTQITRQSSGMELVLVLDNTGSMNCEVTNESICSTTDPNSKINALKSAAATLLGVLYGSTYNTVPNLWVGVVPFSQAVNIGTGNPTWMNSTYDSALEFGPTISGTSCQTDTGVSPNVTGSYSSTPSCAYAIASTTNHTPPAASFVQMNNWAGCVMARSSPYDTSDDPPSVATFQAYDYPPTADAGTTYDPWKTSSTTSHRSGSTTTYTTTTTYNYSYQSSLPGYYGPNLFCPQAVLPMVAEKNTVLNEVNAMTAGGSTLIDIGMAWGYRMLSPRWEGLWGGEMNTNSLPLAYHTPLMNKVIILMTDGENELDPSNFTAYQYLDSGVLGTTNFTTANSTLDTRTLAVCTALKNNGVIIYTIGFGTSQDVNTSLLTSCASQPSYFFLAPTNAQLTSAFQQIGDSLANLRVSK